MNIELSKEADALLCLLYKHYLDQRKTGTARFEAKYFGGTHQIQTNIASNWPFDDLDGTLCELHRAECLSCFFADNIVYGAILSDNGVIYMENRFKGKVQSIISHLLTLKEFIPFL